MYVQDSILKLFINMVSLSVRSVELSLYPEPFTKETAQKSSSNSPAPGTLV